MNILSTSPFEQFSITKLISLKLFIFDFSITNSAIFMVWTLISYLIVLFVLKKGFLVPTIWQSFMELISLQILSMVYENIGDGKYLCLIWTLFLQLTIMNLVGIIPYTFTPTAHVIIAMSMSFAVFISVVYLGFEKYGLNYLASLMPNSSPMILSCMLVMIEFVSQLAKGISLGVRLAANITAGHLLFAILSGFIYTMLCSNIVIKILSLFPIIIIVFITILEIAVALIQAYVFSILTSIYIKDSIVLH